MILVILLVLLLPLLIGLLLVQVLLPASANPPAGRSATLLLLWKLCLAPGAGLALVSLLYFLWGLIFSPTQALAGYLAIELLLLLGLGVYAWRRRSLTGLGLHLKKPSGVHLLAVVAGLVFALFLLNFLVQWQKLAFEKPYGDWDAWAIWNLRGSFHRLRRRVA